MFDRFLQADCPGMLEQEQTGCTLVGNAGFFIPNRSTTRMMPFSRVERRSARIWPLNRLPSKGTLRCSYGPRVITSFRYDILLIAHLTTHSFTDSAARLRDRNQRFGSIERIELTRHKVVTKDLNYITSNDPKKPEGRCGSIRSECQEAKTLVNRCS
jgi:hypothetical protein